MNGSPGRCGTRDTRSQASARVWFHVVGRVQGGAEGEFMGEYWKLAFPNVSQPWLLPYWLLKTHASDFLAYPLGGPKWASTGTLLLCMAGFWQLVQQRRFFCLGLALCPAGLHFIAAAAFQKYPYGGHVKFSQYLAPMICCLAAAGAAQILSWSATGGWLGYRPMDHRNLDESSRDVGAQPAIQEWQAGSPMPPTLVGISTNPKCQRGRTAMTASTPIRPRLHFGLQSNSHQAGSLPQVLRGRLGIAP